MNALSKVFLAICTLLFITDASGQVNASSFRDAYKANSSRKLQNILNIWANESSRACDSIYNNSNDTTKYLYDAFKNFYASQVLDSIGVGWSLKGQNQHFLLLQEHIKWGIVDSFNKKTLFDEPFNFNKQGEIVYTLPNTTYILTNFQPSLNYPNTKLISFTPTRFSILREFLGDYDLGSMNYSSEFNSKVVDSLKNENQKKKDFLGKFIMTWNGSTNWYWSLYSYPYVNKITLSKDFMSVLVDYSLNESQGYAYFEKKNDTWVFINARSTWIQ